MFKFFSKNNENILQKLNFLYIENINEYVEYVGSSVNISNVKKNNVFFEEKKQEYVKAVLHFANYLKIKYSDSFLSQDPVINLELDEITKNIDRIAATLFFAPTYPDLIYICRGSYNSAHLHIKNDHVEEAEHLDLLPGLNKILAQNHNFNKIFRGFSVIEVKAFLEQMHILPKDSELERVIYDYNIRNLIHENFFKSIIYVLLMDNNQYALKRARLFADSLDVKFNFEPYSFMDEGKKLLHNKNQG